MASVVSFQHVGFYLFLASSPVLHISHRVWTWWRRKNSVPLSGIEPRSSSPHSAKRTELPSSTRGCSLLQFLVYLATLSVAHAVCRAVSLLQRLLFWLSLFSGLPFGRTVLLMWRQFWAPFYSTVVTEKSAFSGLSLEKHHVLYLPFSSATRRLGESGCYGRTDSGCYSLHMDWLIVLMA